MDLSANLAVQNSVYPSHDINLMVQWVSRLGGPCFVPTLLVVLCNAYGFTFTLTQFPAKTIFSRGYGGVQNSSENSRGVVGLF